MRFISRKPLPRQALEYLSRRQQDAAAAATLDAVKHWKVSRRNAMLRVVDKTLREMMHPDERCMFCLDSRASDIEHFWPKSPYPERMYSWPNLLLCCSRCNRKKLDRFPLDESTHEPLLLDPTSDDPWAHFAFEHETGTLVPVTERGRQTWRILEFDRDEVLERRYKKSWKRLVEVARDHLASTPMDVERLCGDLREQDDHGLLGWCVKEEAPDPFPALWNKAPGARQILS